MAAYPPTSSYVGPVGPVILGPLAQQSDPYGLMPLYSVGSSIPSVASILPTLPTITTATSFLPTTTTSLLPTTTTTTSVSVEDMFANIGSSDPNKIDIISGPTGTCYYYRDPLPNADVHFRYILISSNWHQDEVKMAGKTIITGRRVCYFSNSDIIYRYSGVTKNMKPWNPYIEYIKNEVERITGFVFNYAVLNLYAEGDHTLGYHRDKEASKGSPIVSISLGSARDFLIKPETEEAEQYWKMMGRDKPYKIPLGHGTMLVMKDAMQLHYKHSVPKRAASSIIPHGIPLYPGDKVSSFPDVPISYFDQARLNITFRTEEE